MLRLMFGKYVIGGVLLALTATAVATKTNAVSYLNTFYSQVSKEVEQNVPTKFELDRIRHEIASLDSDINNMLRPIAEYKATIEKLTKDMATEQETITKNKKTLLDVANQLQDNPKFVTVGNRKLSAETVKKQLDSDTQAMKKAEERLEMAKQVVFAKEDALRATQDQMSKVIAQKRVYEVRLAQLEADEETLKIAKIGSDIRIDTSRSTQIESALTKMEQRQVVERNHLDLLKTPTLNLLNQEAAKDGTIDLNAIRNYLQGEKEQTTAARN